MWQGTMLLAAGADPVSLAHRAEALNAITISRFPGIPKSGLSGHTLIELHVDATGKVTGCTVRNSSGNPALDREACDMTRTLRYKPAKDKMGVSIASPDFRGIDWGLDQTIGKNADKKSQMADQPKLISDISSLFTYDSYPRDARFANTEGRTVTELSIDATGHVTDCVIVNSSGELKTHKSLDAKTCEIAKTLTFSPAHNRQHRSIGSHYILPVRWSLEDDTEMPDVLWETVSLVMTGEASPSGVPHLCEEKLVGNRLPFPFASCEQMLKPYGGVVHPEVSSAGGGRFVIELRLDYPGLKGPPAMDFKGFPALRKSKTFFRISPDGSVSDCRVDTIDYGDDTVPGFCYTHLRFKPILDDRGAPRTVDATITFTWGGQRIPAAAGK